MHSSLYLDFAVADSDFLKFDVQFEGLVTFGHSGGGDHRLVSVAILGPFHRRLGLTAQSHLLGSQTFF